MGWRQGIRQYINFWVLTGAAIVALAMLCILLVVLWLVRPEVEPTSPATAVLYVIPYFSPTPPPATSTPLPIEQGPEGDIPPSPPPGVVAIGASVQISGTAGDGLRLRDEPGLQGVVKYLGLESEIFLVEDGPMMVDGYTWWFLVAPYDESVRGWAVSNYLKAVQNP